MDLMVGWGLEYLTLQWPGLDTYEERQDNETNLKRCNRWPGLGMGGGQWPPTFHPGIHYHMTSLVNIIIFPGRYYHGKRGVFVYLDQFYVQCQQEWGANMMIGADKRLSKAAWHQSGSKVGQFRSQPQCNAQTRFFVHQQSALAPTVSNLKFAKLQLPSEQ